MKTNFFKTAVIIGVIWLINPLELFSQSKNFRKIYEIADDLSFENKFEEALPYWKMLDSISPNNPNIAFNIGLCYLNSSEKGKAIPLLQFASKKASVDYEGSYDERSAPVFAYFFLGEAFHSESKMDEAVKNFNKFKTFLPKEDEEDINAVNNQIQYCLVAKKNLNNPLNVNIQNLGPSVNSSHSDYSPVLFGDNSQLYFTSKRDLLSSSNSKKIIEGKEAIYFTKYNPEENLWSKAIAMGEPFSSNKNIATIGKTWNEKGMYFFKNEEKENGDIYFSAKNENGWEAPNKLSKKINNNTMEYHSFVSYDGSSFFFVSDRKGGYGGKDIWKSSLKENGEWSDPENLGPEINTEYDEDAPYITEDGRTLYFSSTGHESMGDYDVFYSKLQNNGWSNAINIGSPINSMEDDIYFAPSKNGQSAIFSSSRSGGYGEMDIYKIDFEKQNREIMLKCITINQESMPVPSNIILKEAGSGQIINPISIEMKSGEAFFSVQNEKTYEASIFVNDNMEIKENLTILSEKSINQNFNNPENLYAVLQIQDSETISKEFVISDPVIAVIELKENTEETKIVISNIYFGFDKSDLTEETTGELEKISSILIKNSNYKIEIAGHTDNIGSDEYNDKLSLQRAAAAEKFLVEKGIGIERINKNGFGYHKPISDNKTPSGRQLNRRTEFKIFNEKNELIYSSVSLS
ncbi:MAG: OmpA family protein [Bacteroidetes bacterium]|nr:OmpA family protein [Bacteroidota bacterium]